VKRQWHAAWKAQDIVVTLNGKVVDRIDSRSILRVIFVENKLMRTASDHAFAVVDLGDEQLVFPADSGLAGLVHFERQAFWHGRHCVYWLPPSAGALLPARCHERRWLFLRGAPVFTRVLREDLAAFYAASEAMEGPQSWDERRWQHIQDRQSVFAPLPTDPQGANDHAPSVFGLHRHRA
jgi:hypothetical protein